MFKKIIHLLMLSVLLFNTVSFAYIGNEDNKFIEQDKYSSNELILDLPVTLATTGTTYKTLGFHVTVYPGATDIDPATGVATPYVPPENVLKAYVEHALNDNNIYMMYVATDDGGKKSIFSSLCNANGIAENSETYYRLKETMEHGWVATFDSVITVVVNGSPKGSVTKDENGYITGFGGTVYETPDGIVNAAPWDAQSKVDLPNHFNIHMMMAGVTVPLKDIIVENQGDDVAEAGEWTVTEFPIYNNSLLDVRYCDIQVTLDGKPYNNGIPTAVFVPAKDFRVISIGWQAPDERKDIGITLSANTSKVVDEEDYTNNSGSVNVKVMDFSSDPDVNNNASLTWKEPYTDKNGFRKYRNKYAELEVKASVNPMGMKSGYGFEANVTVDIDTNSDKVTPVTKVLSYFPDDSYTNGYELVRVNSSGLKSTWEFPVNEQSKVGAKKWYVPVEFPDKTNYTVKFRAEGARTPKGELYTEITKDIYIDANMFEDDITHSN